MSLQNRGRGRRLRRSRSVGHRLGSVLRFRRPGRHRGRRAWSLRHRAFRWQLRRSGSFSHRFFGTLGRRRSGLLLQLLGLRGPLLLDRRKNDRILLLHLLMQGMQLLFRQLPDTLPVIAFELHQRLRPPLELFRSKLPHPLQKTDFLLFDADTDGFIHIVNKDFAIPDFSGPGRSYDDIHGAVGLGVGENQFDF